MREKNNSRTKTPLTILLVVIFLLLPIMAIIVNEQDTDELKKYGKPTICVVTRHYNTIKNPCFKYEINIYGKIYEGFKSSHDLEKFPIGTFYHAKYSYKNPRLSKGFWDRPIPRDSVLYYFKIYNIIEPRN